MAASTSSAYSGQFEVHVIKWSVADSVLEPNNWLVFERTHPRRYFWNCLGNLNNTEICSRCFITMTMWYAIIHTHPNLKIFPFLSFSLSFCSVEEEAHASFSHLPSISLRTNDIFELRAQNKEKRRRFSSAVSLIQSRLIKWYAQLRYGRSKCVVCTLRSFLSTDYRPADSNVFIFQQLHGRSDLVP